MRRMNALNTPVELASTVASEETVAAPPQPRHVEQPVNMSLLNLWVVLYGFVGTQLAWTLRPFFGDPDKAFEIFRNIEGNFYVNILHSIASAFR
jgi:hypothetical protein